MHTTYTRKAHGINEEAVRNMYGKHEVLRTVQLLREMRKEHGCHKETAWVNKQRMKSRNTTPLPFEDPRHEDYCDGKLLQASNRCCCRRAQAGVIK